MLTGTISEFDITGISLSGQTYTIGPKAAPAIESVNEDGTSSWLAGFRTDQA